MDNFPSTAFPENGKAMTSDCGTAERVKNKDFGFTVSCFLRSQKSAVKKLSCLMLAIPEQSE